MASAVEIYQEPIALVGINHRTLGVEERECLSELSRSDSNLLQTFAGSGGVREAALLSTCNRFELITVGAADEQRLLTLIQRQAPRHIDSGKFYLLKNREALRHMFRVTSSLDSMVLGEAQILGQVKTAYAQAVQSGCVGTLLHHAFQFSFRIAKKVRAHTAVAEKGVSVSYVAVRLAEQIFGDLKNSSVLILGSGNMAELAALHLKTYGAGKITVANRTLSHAAELAERIGGSAVELGAVQGLLSEVDIVIGSISCDRPVLELSAVKALRRHKPLFLIDLGVPRNFQPALGEIDNIYLYNIDDLAKISDENKEFRECAAKDAEIIIDYGVFQFERWLKKIKADPTILDFRARVRAVCEAELERALGRLDPAVKEQELSELSHRISQKLAHELSGVISGVRQGKADKTSILSAIFDDLLEFN